jgi:hypothetical protein
MLPIVLDFLDTSLRTPIDLHRAIGFAPTGWLPEVGPPGSVVLFEEQIRRLAVKILRDVLAHGRGVAFFVTECLPEAGKTFLIYKLADHTQELGLRRWCSPPTRPMPACCASASPASASTRRCRRSTCTRSPSWGWWS